MGNESNGVMGWRGGERDGGKKKAGHTEGLGKGNGDGWREERLMLADTELGL